MSVQKFLGIIETDGIKDEMGIETPSLSATGEVSGKTGVFSESVTAPVFNGKATSAGSADNATNATNAVNDGAGSNIANTYATKAALAEETSAREAADETLSKGITAEATERSAAIEDIVDGTTVVAEATNATNVTSKINGKNISDIFESGGVTAKKATNATNIIPDESGAVNRLGRKADSDVGVNSTALGYNSSAQGESSTALGIESNASGMHSTAIGCTSKALGIGSTALGLNCTASGYYSTALGYISQALGESSTALGLNARVSSTDSNTMQLGDTNLSALRCKVNLTVTSDKRDKTDIESITDALAFIERLNPVTFVSNDRVEYISDEDKEGETFRKYGMCEYDRASHAAGTKKGERRRCGLLAQEVVEAMQSVYGTDNYANVVNDNFHDLAQKPSDVENKYTLAYANLVPFLIGAIKELNAKIKALESKL